MILLLVGILIGMASVLMVMININRIYPLPPVDFKKPINWPIGHESCE